MRAGPFKSILHAAASRATGCEETERPTLLLVGDDDATRFLRRAVELTDVRVETFASTEEFLAAHSPGRPACLVVYARLHRVGRHKLRSLLALCEQSIPVIFLTRQADVTTVVAMMRAGAADILIEPVSADLVVERACRAIAVQAEATRRDVRRSENKTRLDRLTPRQRGVRELAVAGLANKQIAARMSISPKTVEIHRARVMKRLNVRNLAELAHVVLSGTAGM